jgi:hypothetical protein
MPVALVSSAQAGAAAITPAGGEGVGGGYMGGQDGAHRSGKGKNGHFKHPRFVNNRVFFVAGVPWWSGYNDPCWWWNPQWGWVWSCDDSSGDDGD